MIGKGINEKQLCEWGGSKQAWEGSLASFLLGGCSCTKKSLGHPAKAQNLKNVGTGLIGT